MNRLEFLKRIKIPKLGRLSIIQVVFWGVALALSVGIFIFGRNFTACWNLTDLPGRTLSTCQGGTNPLAGPDLNPQGTPNAVNAAPPTPDVLAPEVPMPPAWDGASRINILFLGLDARDLAVQDGPPRSDTMMLVTIDPISKTAGMLSIPRDMWVNIPGYGYSRINTAYASGEGDKYPGGGPGLAMKTVSQFIGVPVNYYVQVDFNVFTEIVDRFGCIQVRPSETMILDLVGTGTDHFKLTTGGYRDLCTGKLVLAYARDRHTSGGDFDRAKRQQEVILALRKKIFDPQVFPCLLAQAPQMYQELSYGIHTNMALEDALKLAVLAKDVDPAGIKQGVIDTKMVTFDHVVLAGQDASIMKPIADKIRVLRDEIFTTSGPLSPLAQGDPVTLMRAEEARVRIVDCTFTAGLDQRAGAYFQSQGMNVTEVGQANEAYTATTVIVYGPKLYTLKYLQTVLGIPTAQIRFNPDPASTVDIEIRLGSDIAGSIP